MVDCVKDIEFRLQDKCKRALQGKINSVDEDFNSEIQEIQDERDEEYVDLDARQDIEACMVEVNLDAKRDIESCMVDGLLESESCKFCKTPFTSSLCLLQQPASLNVIKECMVDGPSQSESYEILSLPSLYLSRQPASANVVELNLVHTPKSTAVWYLDSGATHHITSNHNLVVASKSHYQREDSWRSWS